MIAEDIAAFLELLPKKIDGLKLRHALEVRNESFRSADFIAQVRKAGVAVVLADSQKYPLIADLSADFVYARLQDAKADVETGYSAKAIKTWATLAKAWEGGEEPEQFPLAAPKGQAAEIPRCIHLLHQRRKGTGPRRGRSPDQAFEKIVHTSHQA